MYVSTCGNANQTVYSHKARKRNIKIYRGIAEGVFAKRFEKKKKSVGTETKTNNHLTDSITPN